MELARFGCVDGFDSFHSFLRFTFYRCCLFSVVLMVYSFSIVLFVVFAGFPCLSVMTVFLMVCLNSYDILLVVLILSDCFHFLLACFVCFLRLKGLKVLIVSLHICGFPRFPELKGLNAVAGLDGFDGFGYFPVFVLVVLF